MLSRLRTGFDDRGNEMTMAASHAVALELPIDRTPPCWPQTDGRPK
jgi:hypothetical protein